jgi:hypothetical protein
LVRSKRFSRSVSSTEAPRPDPFMALSSAAIC